jgi:hypothetical protein
MYEYNDVTSTWAHKLCLANRELFEEWREAEEYPNSPEARNCFARELMFYTAECN